jgi:hypothetical protein
VDRASGQVVADPPDPVPAGWLDRFAWRISRAEVEALVERMPGKTAFLCGSAENEADVSDLFDLVVCLVLDTETLRRLPTRSSLPLRRIEAAANRLGRHAKGGHRRHDDAPSTTGYPQCELAVDAELIVSELVTNALKASQTLQEIRPVAYACARTSSA